ncbi:hypothetical protein NQ314_018783 [Rhamnusium bicolor]|uniref:PiggyBac transposable element-derived protein domain-containing protein n=1 Tax=Rhamnusium bicolor TaxID=1586634 RepID=A0AAV8WQT0_9CUCU|nr:hypothetical protein NQ314_018783 [Rhamnusium bicolor]
MIRWLSNEAPVSVHTRQADLKIGGGLTLEEALQMAYFDDLDVSKIYVEPPEPSQLTDEDSGEDDDNLSANQLRASAKLKIIEKQSREESSDREDNIEDNGNPTNSRNHENSVDYIDVAKVDYNDITWIDADLEYVPKPFPITDYEKFKRPTEMFELFFCQDVISLLVSESIKYSQFKNCPNFSGVGNEIRCLLAILILSSYNTLPGKIITGISAGTWVMNLVRMLCEETDLTLFFIQVKFLQYFVPEQDLNYEESMVKYFGRHSCKQFIRGEPIGFLLMNCLDLIIKIWIINTKSGYLVNFIPYQGSDPRISGDYQNVFGKAVAPFLTMLNELPDTNLRYFLYFNNLFTSMYLLSNLRALGYGVTETIRNNRVRKNCPLPSKANVHTLDKTNGILLVRWADNNIVSMASKTYGISPLGEVKRYSQAQKKNFQVPRPLAIGEYNSSMGGTELMNENISRSSSRISDDTRFDNLGHLLAANKDGKKKEEVLAIIAALL